MEAIRPVRDSRDVGSILSALRRLRCAFEGARQGLQIIAIIECEAGRGCGRHQVLSSARKMSTEAGLNHFEVDSNNDQEDKESVGHFGYLDVLRWLSRAKLSQSLGICKPMILLVSSCCWVQL